MNNIPRKKWMICAGARPNFVKIASLIKEIKQHPSIQPLIVHTGQHYSKNLSSLFFTELDIPFPDINLEVGSASHARQTAAVLERFETVLLEHQPDLVIVVGDVNSTLACTLAAVKLHIKVAHVEAGLRSFDKRMPEEINRRLTDSVADYLFITEPSANTHLLAEGIPTERIFYVGNTMIDTLLSNLPRALQSTVLQHHRLTPRNYAVLTLHRPSNVDKKEDLLNIRCALQQIASQLPVIFPVHPRTLKLMNTYGLPFDFLTTIPPLGYLDFIKLLHDSRCVLTDSGGIQEETSILGIPCLTLRHNTERPVTVDQGTNTIVGTDPQTIVNQFNCVMQQEPVKKTAIKYWDGHAAQRIVKILKEL